MRDESRSKIDMAFAPRVLEQMEKANIYAC